MQQQPWMAFAWAELGVREAAGGASNPRVIALFRDAGHPGISSDETAWCAAYVGACLERAGVRSSRALNARSYLQWGERVLEPSPGAIAVLSRTSDPALGHVGFVVGATNASVLLLGGNQSDSVTVAAFDKARLLGFRLPKPEAAATIAPAADASFERAFSHVLEMEGGYTEDPHDPGGPTNLGITLADWARHRNVAVTAETFPALKQELRSVDRDTVRPIYRDRYWRPSRAPELPRGLALMHFDAAVNHGLGRAARILQESLGVTVDGEIGPETLGAARSTADTSSVLARYAEIRLRTYRALPHFWRFGRGWQRRVDLTLARARAEGGVPTASSTASRKETSSMPADTSANVQSQLPAPIDDATKWWGQSMTIWGVLLTTVTTVLPTVGPLIGLDINAELARQLGDGVVRVVQSTGGLAGTVLAILGRARATVPLERRMMQVRV